MVGWLVGWLAGWLVGRSIKLPLRGWKHPAHAAWSPPVKHPFDQSVLGAVENARHQVENGNACVCGGGLVLHSVKISVIKKCVHESDSWSRATKQAQGAGADEQRMGDYGSLCIACNRSRRLSHLELMFHDTFVHQPGLGRVSRYVCSLVRT